MIFSTFFFNCLLNSPRFLNLIVKEIACNFLSGGNTGVMISQISDNNVYFQLKVPIVYCVNGKTEKYGDFE